VPCNTSTKALLGTLPHHSTGLLELAQIARIEVDLAATLTDLGKHLFGHRIARGLEAGGQGLAGVDEVRIAGKSSTTPRGRDL